MFRYLARIALLSTLAYFSVTVAAWAQNGELRIDSRHSTASLSLASSSSGTSWNIGIAKVSGALTHNDNPEKDAVHLVIYPAGQGSRLLNPSGGLKENSIAGLARYTVMSFHASQVTQNRDGKVVATGELSLTHVTREVSAIWSNAYSGAEYGDPIAQTTTHQVTFIFQAPNQTAAALPDHGAAEKSAVATISLHDFPGLRSAWLDSVWPLVVEDEHCETPGSRASFRDYSGVKCTGTPILTTPIYQPPPPIVRGDYPLPYEVNAPASDEATIVVHLRLEGRG
jgi:polyisoprenoid-binding protein YceI